MKIPLIVPALTLVACAATHGLHAQAPTPSRSAAPQAVGPRPDFLLRLDAGVMAQVMAKCGHCPPKGAAEDKIYAKWLDTDPTAMLMPELNMNGQALGLKVSKRASSPEKLVSIWLPKLRSIAKQFDLKASGIHYLGVFPVCGKTPSAKEYNLMVRLDDGVAFILDVATKAQTPVPWGN